LDGQANKTAKWLRKGLFNNIRVDLDAPISQEATEAVAVFGDVGESLAQGRFGRRAGTVVGQPIVDAAQDWSGAVLPDRKSGVGAVAADIGFDGV
jgi:hypothetical protein